MNIDNKSHEGKDVNGDTNARRRFVKRAAAVSLITVVPAKVSWAQTAGCTVSGTLSGSLSRPCDEETPTVSGYSPGTWGRVFNKESHHDYHSFGDYLPADLPDSDWDCTWGEIFGIGRPPFHYGTSDSMMRQYFHHYTPSEDGFSGGIDRQLLAAYLNAVVGEYPLAVGQTPEGYVQGLYDLVYNGVYTESQLEEAIVSTQTQD